MSEQPTDVRDGLGPEKSASTQTDDALALAAGTIIPPCAGCGRCCHQVVGLVEGVDHVPEEWVVEHEGQRCLDQRADGACVALDPLTRLCTIYENRPTVCRAFERAGELCRQVLARHDAALKRAEQRRMVGA